MWAAGPPETGVSLSPPFFSPHSHTATLLEAVGMLCCARTRSQMDDVVATFSTLARVEEMRAARDAKKVGCC